MDLVLPAGAVAALFLAGWLASLRLRDASVADLLWGPAFVLLAWLQAAVLDGFAGRRLLVAAMVTVWGLRLGWHLLRRRRGQGEDFRYAAMRRRWGTSFPLVSLFTVFLLQAAIVGAVALPLRSAQASSIPAHLTGWDLAGVVVFLAGLGLEVVADRQLARFRADPGNRGRVLAEGLWRYSRHPNYFGDALVWWGIGLVGMAAPGSVWTLAGPLLMTVLLRRVSGVTLLEGRLLETRPGYKDYVRRTNAFVPWLPRRT